MKWMGSGSSLIARLLALLSFSAAARASDVDYLRDVKPLLKEKCGACHGPLAQKAGLRLDAGELVRKGGESGAVIDFEKPDESGLLLRVTAEDADRMPPASDGERLTPSEVAILKGWILSGAKSPVDEEVLADPRAHWAYQVPQRPKIPHVLSVEWMTNPVDAFLSQQHAVRGLEPNGLADRPTLLRRIYLDLVGLPPTPEELHAFLDDEAPDAYENVVDRLLDSPQYGERWGRHWMDVWRYSDWDGFKNEVRGSQPNIWRWREWIVESLNADKGYDHMIVEMLAGDEIAPENPDVLRATGFLARNYSALAGKPNRDTWLENDVEHTAKGFLGITLNCAKCHDHKYDPISQKDFYRFRAIFEPHDVRADRLPGQPDLQLDGIARTFDSQLDAPTYLYVRGNEKHPDKDHPLEAGVPASLAGAAYAPKAITIPLAARAPMLQEFVEREDVAAAEIQSKQSSDEAERLRGSDASGGALRVAELKAAANRLKVDALRARWAADKVRYGVASAGPLDDEQARQTARLERAANLAAVEQSVVEKVLAHEVASAGAAAAPDDADKKARLTRAEKELESARKRLTTTEEALENTDGNYTPVVKVYPEKSTGRRLALARWIAASDNPLTARVAVNQMWLKHFGTPLVENVFDFGLNSPRPELLELLDWLACEFMHCGLRISDCGLKSEKSKIANRQSAIAPSPPLKRVGESGAWGMKHVHRLMVTSRAYRLSSNDGAGSETNRTIDPTNRLYWKYTARRLEAEAVRDSVLAAAGNLDLRLGGPDIDFNEGETVTRRSIYFRTAYEKQMRLLVLFDGPSPKECYRRSSSIVPQQALALANSPLTLSQSRILARSLWTDVAGISNDAAAEFVRRAFERILIRQPTTIEEQTCLEFLRTQTLRLVDAAALTAVAAGTKPQIAPDVDPAGRARENLIHALYNHTDFVTVR